MKKTYDFCTTVTLFLMAFLLAMSGVRKNDEALAARIAPDILRFHVLANSDLPGDQALKLEVKDFLLEEIRSGLGETASLSKEYVQDYILDNKTALETAADTCIEQCGFDYTAEICLETCEFPQKTYGDMTFPAGTYDAVRVILGNGAGQNFWCVLYPSLCYLDSTHAVVPDDSKELLKTLVADDDFLALLSARRLSWTRSGMQSFSPSAPAKSRAEKTEQESPLPRLNIRFKFADLIH